MLPRSTVTAISLLACVVTLAGATMLGVHAAMPAAGTIVVDAGTPIRRLPATFFGINYVGFWDNHQGSAASARALAHTPIKLVRFPGGDPADWYDWQDPYYKGWSRTSPSDLWQYVRVLGGTALFQTNYQGHLPNPPGHTYAVNSPQNAAAWVRYNRTHGIKAIMEVGNEEDITMRSRHDRAFQRYIDLFTAQARAMHAVDRWVKVIGPAGTNEWYWWGLDALGMFLHQTGNRSGSGQVDGVSLHFYKGSSWDDSRGVAQHWLQPDGPWAFIQQTIRANDTRKLPVYVSEWNVGAAGVNNNFNDTLAHALVTADMIGAFAQSGVAGEVYFDLHSARGWGLLYGDGEGRPVDTPTPTYYATALWSAMGPYVLRPRSADDPATTLSAYATRRDDGSVQVLAINKLGKPQRLHIAFTHFDPRGHTLHVYDVRGNQGRLTDLDADYDGVLMPSPARRLPGPRVTGRITGNAVTYTMPPYSVVVLAITS
jgi:hypothetical protein